MSKFIRILLLLPLLSLTATAQQVSWKNTVKHLGGDTYQIVFEASVPAAHHMYDMGPYVDGPLATTIVIAPGEGVTLDGKVEQLDKPIRHFDKIMGMEIGYFEGKPRFAQKIRLTVPESNVTATLEWMICTESSCMPPDDLELTIPLKAVAGSVKAQTPPTPEKPASATQTQPAITADTAAQSPAEVAAAADITPSEPAPATNIAPEQKDAAGGGSLWALIIEAVLWGFAALLTPCVFPMVPMTVSFFMKGSDNPTRGRIRATLYGFFIVALYTLPIAAIILATRALGGGAVTADIFNWLATHWLPNILFFLVFMVFAASFFGAFEITMPSWMVNKTDSKADSKGLGGIFFMALTLVLVSFSCTGPIVGSVLIKSTSGEFWNPIVTMFAFSLAFALPFTLFAFFPSVLKQLPKSGGWLNSVKVVLGFIEVALGMKFLSVADQTYHWGLLDREIYLAVWIVVFTLLGLYLLGKLRFVHDDEMPYLTVKRLALSIISFSFVVYLIPGMWGAPLKGLSGYLPPLHTQDFVVGQGGPGTSTNTTTPALLTADGRQPIYSDLLHLPHGLEGFFDMAEAEAYAAKVNKPIFLDFTGHGCVNCREMEARVWSDPQVLDILRRDYVIVALYVDDKKEVPESQWVTTDTGKVLKSLGKINSYYALKNYGVNAQPYYVLQGRNGKVLVPPRKYDLSVEGFVAFLKSGVEAYKAQ